MTEQGREPSIVDSWADNPLATVVAAGAGALVGFVFASCWPKKSKLLSGDEAPIRVKNGSLEVKLLRATRNHRNQRFQEIGNKRWKIQGGPPRGRPKYTALALPADPHNCPNGLLLIGSHVEVVYSNDRTVLFDATGANTIVESSLLEQTEPERLNSGELGHISQVVVGGRVLFESNQADPELQVVLLDL